MAFVLPNSQPVLFFRRTPCDLDTPFGYLMDPDWSEVPGLPESFSEILDLSESELEYICDRMKKPEWTRSPRHSDCSSRFDPINNEIKPGLRSFTPVINVKGKHRGGTPVRTGPCSNQIRTSRLTMDLPTDFDPVIFTEA